MVALLSSPDVARRGANSDRVSERERETDGEALSPTRPFVRTPASLKPSSRSSPSARGRGSLSPPRVLGVRWRSGLVRFAPRFSAFVPSANLMFPSFPDPILSRGVRDARAKSFWPNLCSNRVFAAAGCGGLRADLRTFPPQLFCSPPSAEARVRGIERAHEVGFASGRRRWGAGGKDFSARARLDPHEDGRCARKACVRRFWNQAVSLHHAAAQRHLKE